MDIEFEEPGTLARIQLIDEIAGRAYLEFRNGITGSVTGDSVADLEVGNVVLVRTDDGFLRVVSDDLWRGETSIGVVRLVLDDVTIIETGGRWVKVPTRTEPPYEEKATVEFDESRGVTRVLATQSIRTIDLSDTEAVDVGRFKVDVENLKDSFDDFGGLDDVVARAQELIELPLKRSADLQALGVRPIKGVLFTGPPGTGKTMLARIIASNAGAKFFEIRGPEFLGKYYGQSEEVLRGIFEDAATQQRAIIFFDEIDSVAGQRSEDAHEVSRRIVAQLLTLMDGFTKDDNVIVIATTNRPQDLDSALRRPGRFDWQIDFPLPDERGREAIMRKKAPHSAEEPLPHEHVAAQTQGWSGADLSLIWTEAGLLAIGDERKVILAEDYVGGLERVRKQRASVLAVHAREKV